MYGWDQQLSMFDGLLDLSFFQAPMPGDSHWLLVTLQPDESVSVAAIEMGDWFVIDAQPSSTNVSIDIDVAGKRASPGSLGVTGYDAPDADRIIDPVVAGD